MWPCVYVVHTRYKGNRAEGDTLRSTWPWGINLAEGGVGQSQPVEEEEGHGPQQLGERKPVVKETLMLSKAWGTEYIGRVVAPPKCNKESKTMLPAWGEDCQRQSRFKLGEAYVLVGPQGSQHVLSIIALTNRDLIP